MGWMSMSTRARGEGVKRMGVYDCWAQELGLAIYGCFTYIKKWVSVSTGARVKGLEDGCLKGPG